MVVTGGHDCCEHHPKSQWNCLLPPPLQLSVFGSENTSTGIHQTQTPTPSSPGGLLMKIFPNNVAIILSVFFVFTGIIQKLSDNYVRVH